MPLYGKIHDDYNCPLLPRINVIALLGYHLSLSDDLDDLYIAELEDEAEKSGPQKIPL